MTAILLDDNAPPQLEVVSCLPERSNGGPPLVFVHGAFAGAWCWAEHFLPYFAEQGWAAHAFSLRGHGGSDGHERLLWTSLGEYVDDLAEVVGQLDAPPVLVGHSMGGMIIQKYLERAEAPAVVLMASVPPEGLLGSSMQLALSDPWLAWELYLIEFGGPYFATLGGARRALFSETLPTAQVAHYFGRFQAESQRVLMDMSWYDLPRRRRSPEAPTLVLGAERDALVPSWQVESTGRAFGVRPEFFPGMAHAMMLDTEWRQVAERIRVWLEQQMPGTIRPGE